MRFEIKKRVWVEDDATRGLDGHEGLSEAWQRIVGTPFDRTGAQTLFMLDHGDCVEYVMRAGEKMFFVRLTPDCCEIYEAQPFDT